MLEYLAGVFARLRVRVAFRYSAGPLRVILPRHLPLPSLLLAVLCCPLCCFLLCRSMVLSVRYRSLNSITVVCLVAQPSSSGLLCRLSPSCNLLVSSCLSSAGVGCPGLYPGASLLYGCLSHLALRLCFNLPAPMLSWDVMSLLYIYLHNIFRILHITAASVARLEPILCVQSNLQHATT